MEMGDKCRNEALSEVVVPGAKSKMKDQRQTYGCGARLEREWAADGMLPRHDVYFVDFTTDGAVQGKQHIREEFLEDSW